MLFAIIVTAVVDVGVVLVLFFICYSTFIVWILRVVHLYYFFDIIFHRLNVFNISQNPRSVYY